MCAESVLPNLESRALYESGAFLFEITNHYDALNSRLTTCCTLRHNDGVSQQNFSHAVYTVGELRRMLADTGLMTTTLFSNLTGDDYVLGAQRLVVVALKK